MKIRRETQLGILAFFVIALSIWGYTFMKGRNILKKTKTVYVKYDSVDQLEVANSIFVKGFKIGTVNNIEIDPEDKRSLLVTLTIEEDLGIPKDAVAYIVNPSIAGSREIRIDFDKACSGPDCIESGDYLKGGNIGLLGASIEKTEIDEYVKLLGNSFSGLLDSLKKSGGDINASESVNDLQTTLKNLAESSKRLNHILGNSSSKISNTMSHLESVSQNLSANNEKIDRILSNLDNVTEQLKTANLPQTVESIKGTFEKTGTTVEELDVTIKELKGVIAKINSGEGTLGKLSKDDKLYDSLEDASSNLNALLEDLKENPKRYVNFSVFGKKDKKENDRNTEE
jgi:phospholipid/cholesterol/gamma-HCH transport system substrate-binding protein